MQTFLPYADIYKSLDCLDKRRLGKQRVEADQILRILLGEQKGKGWINHPCVRMWRGYEQLLCIYRNTSLVVFAEHGGNNIKLQKRDINFPIKYPDWWGNEEFHRSHRQALLFKNFEHYSQYFDEEVPYDIMLKDIYNWPVELISQSVTHE